MYHGQRKIIIFLIWIIATGAKVEIFCKGTNLKFSSDPKVTVYQIQFDMVILIIVNITEQLNEWFMLHPASVT